MNRNTALNVLFSWDRQGYYVYRFNDLAKLFPGDNRRALQEGVYRLVKAGVLERVCKGIYVFAYSQNRGSYTIEAIAKAMRRGEYNYTSLESALSEYGAISQIPIDRLTVMTTGREGEYHTPYGVIEFTHTKRNPIDIINSMKSVGRPLRLATKQSAWRDLKRVGRNIDLVDKGALEND